ncbi:MAG: putative Ig domain-containing protein, partial [Candidatus Thermoplasmatota archaeon]|nr:putative Ig domain-containing protein [Candidatus Thermoplasmatota archaeon]
IVHSDVAVNQELEHTTTPGSGKGVKQHTTWQISPALPYGLHMNWRNGTISGTPPSIYSNTTHTVYANISGNSVSTTIYLEFQIAAPNISYSPDSFDLDINTVMAPATPINSGGTTPSGILESIGSSGLYTSIALDSNENIHISYYDQTNGDLKYATDKSGSWVITTLDSAGTVGLFTSIAIDSNDNVHISYYDQTNGDLKYITDNSSSWVATTVDGAGGGISQTGDVGKYTSIALNSNGFPVISYFAESGDNLKFAAYGCLSGGNCLWSMTNVDSTGLVGKFSSIVVDSNDASHISYYDETNQNLKYATDMSSSWVTTTVDNTGNTGFYTSITVDSNDDIHIAYNDEGNDDLKYATDMSGSWVTSTIDSVGDVGSHPSIAIDSNDKVHISYCYWTGLELKYATNKNGIWVDYTIDSDAGYYNSIAIDSSNEVHISTHDMNNDDLKYIALDSSSNMYGYTISPDLSAGLSMDKFTGIISGTPTTFNSRTMYTITATNSGGTSTTYVNITVNDEAPVISYSPLVLTKGIAMTPESPTSTGGAVISWAMGWGMALPVGLSL